MEERSFDRPLSDQPLAADIITLQIQPYAMRAALLPDSVDVEARRVDLVVSTGAPVLRRTWDGAYFEQLSLDPKHVNLRRLNNGAPLLDSHGGGGLFSAGPSLSSQLGVVESARVEKVGEDGRQLVGRVRFAKAED